MKNTQKSTCVITLTTTTFSYFFFKLGFMLFAVIVFHFKKKRCKGADDVVVKFFSTKEGMCLLHIETYFLSK